jgi:hypothetical protein
VTFFFLLRVLAELTGVMVLSAASMSAFSFAVSEILGGNKGPRGDKVCKKLL